MVTVDELAKNPAPLAVLADPSTAFAPDKRVEEPWNGEGKSDLTPEVRGSTLFPVTKLGTWSPILFTHHLFHPLSSVRVDDEVHVLWRKCPSYRIDGYTLPVGVVSK